MPTDAYLKLKSLIPEFIKASEEGASQDVKDILDKQEDALIRLVTPEERYEYMLEGAAYSFNQSKEELDTEIAEQSRSDNPAIKTGFLEGQLHFITNLSKGMNGETPKILGVSEDQIRKSREESEAHANEVSEKIRKLNEDMDRHREKMGKINAYYKDPLQSKDGPKIIQ